MTFVNKLSKSFRWLRCSTLCAILFYMFFIGLILHSTSHKLQLHQQQQQQQHQQQQQKEQQRGEQLHPVELGTATDSASAKAPPHSRDSPLELEQHKENFGNAQAKKSAGGMREEQELQPIAANELEAGVGKGGDGGVAVGGGGKSKLQQPQPETVIITTSNVNEKQILAKAFKR